MTDSLSFPSEEGKYTGSDMDYTYGDAKQKMRSVSEDLKILALKLPKHTLSMVYNFLRTWTLPGATVSSSISILKHLRILES